MGDADTKKTLMVKLTQVVAKGLGKPDSYVAIQINDKQVRNQLANVSRRATFVTFRPPSLNTHARTDHDVGWIRRAMRVVPVCITWRHKPAKQQGSVQRHLRPAV